MRVLLLDGYYLLHRARTTRWSKFSSNSPDSNSIVYNFLRGLRPIVEKFKPQKIYFVLEGSPKKRLSLYPEYKADRANNIKEEHRASFKRQKYIIYDIVQNMPIETIYHPDFECDDVIAGLINNRHQDDECIIISNDSDFIQIYSMSNKSTIYSPSKKEFILPTEYNICHYKALVGDSDNIKGVPGIGNKTAMKILNGNGGINSWKSDNPKKSAIFEKNLELILFEDISDKMNDLINYVGKSNFSYVKEKLRDIGINSMLKESTWNKFVKTFSNIG